MSPANLDRLRGIKTLPQLVAYLRDVLDWPIESDDTAEITFDYTAAELGLDEKAAVRIKEIKQLRPLASGQPWGVFFINFEKKRLPVVAMRRILRALAVRKRESANRSERQAWQSSDLLFISAYGEDSDRALTFAHFVESPDLNLAELRVLGWDDDDTPLKLDYVVRTLGEKLRWQDDFATHPKKWRAQWSEAFRIRHGHVIRTSAELAHALAVLARRIRARVSKILEMEAGTGEIRTLQRAFRIGLIHDLDDAAFADMFAQTITYGLFSLACRRTHPGAGTAFVKDDLSHYFTSPFLKEMLGIFLGIKSRRGKIDFDELGISDVTDLLTSPDTYMEAVLIEFGNKTRGEDPVVHFYEDFLSAYNKQLKVQRGVFYTPQPVVSYIVRSVHELLQTEFGLADGLADTTTWGEMVKKHPGLKLPPLTDEPGEERMINPGEFFVQVLDIATGTATFLVEVIDVIHRHLEAKWKSGTGILPVIPGQHWRDARATFKTFAAYWNAYVPAALLPRLYGYELMMAPYAIAHMKFGLKLAETGYQFAADERARIYLTNALEPKVSQLPQLGFDALAREAGEVNEIKWYKRFTVVVGNPPYSISSSNLSESHRAIVEPYKWISGVRIVEKGARQFEKNIQDDYVKFIRLAEVTILSAGAGIIGCITNHSYLTNPTFRGLRYSLLQSFHRADFVDLHGNTLYGEAKESQANDENVFDIQQGVAICLLRSYLAPTGRSFNRTDYWGPRVDKYRKLGQRSITADKRIPLQPGPDFWVFRAEDRSLREEYQKFPRISEIMPVNSTGVKTHRDHFALAFDQDVLKSRLRSFRDQSISDREIESKFDLADTDAWRLSAKRKSLRSRKDWEKFLVLALHRPFDLKWIYYHPDIVELPRSEVMQNLLPRESGNIAICFPRNLREGWKSHIFVSRDVVHKDALSSLDTCYAAPLYVSSATELNLSHELTPNLAKAARAWAKQLEVELDTKGCRQVFDYFYAVIFAPSFGSRYAEFLKIDFPRLPLTGNLELFRSLARLGGELVALHLLESPKLDHPITEWVGGRNPEVEKISWSKNTVWVDKAQTVGFRGVREPVWNFHIGGYQVCEKWLKDRKGRTLTKDDIAHYHKIVVALAETIRIMEEIDEVIEKRGGWPGAFAAASTSGSAVVRYPDTEDTLAYAAEEPTATDSAKPPCGSNELPLNF